MGIEITLLGTGNPLPDPARAGAATLVARAGSPCSSMPAGASRFGLRLRACCR